MADIITLCRMLDKEYSDLTEYILIDDPESIKTIQNMKDILIKLDIELKKELGI